MADLALGPWLEGKGMTAVKESAYSRLPPEASCNRLIPMNARKQALQTMSEGFEPPKGGPGGVQGVMHGTQRPRSLSWPTGHLRVERDGGILNQTGTVTEN